MDRILLYDFILTTWNPNFHVSLLRNFNSVPSLIVVKMDMNSALCLATHLGSIPGRYGPSAKSDLPGVELPLS